MRRSLVLLSAGLTVLSTGLASAQNNTPRNLILFIPDGLRALKVTPETAPAMAEVRDKGVNFKNPHSLFPTFTMANGSAMSTGHYLGDTGVFSNTIWTNYTSVPAGDTVVPFIENDAVLGDIDEHFKGDYLNEETILKMARDKGLSTAAIGKVGPTYQFDHTDKPEKPGLHSVVFDDSTGGKNGVALSDEVKARADQGRPAARDAAARRQQQGGRRQDAGHARSPTSRSRPISPTSPPRWCCRCSRSATSRSCWCSGRAIPTAASTTPATASTRSCPASTGRPRWPASRTPTTTSPSSARRSTSSALPPRPTSSSRPTTASRPSPRRARPALGQGQL